jgi:transposase
LIGSTVAEVARKERLTYDRVEGALERLLESEVNWDEVQSLELLGLDEIALKKGHRDFVVPVTTRTTEGELKLLGILPNRQRETVERFLRQFPERLRRQVREVCTDMYEGYTNAVREVLPQARIVVDRFHVAKAYRDCADRLRKEVQRELKAELSETEYEALKGTMWLFRRAPQELEEEEKQRLELLFECAPEVKQAHQLREELTAIFETEQRKESGQAAMEDWQKRVRESGLRCFDSFLTTLGYWMEEITNYFVSRLRSGFVEGFNNKIKVLKRRCYGILNLKHLYQRLCLDLEGYRLFGF